MLNLIDVLPLLSLLELNKTRRKTKKHLLTAWFMQQSVPDQQAFVRLVFEGTRIQLPILSAVPPSDIRKQSSSSSKLPTPPHVADCPYCRSFAKSATTPASAAYRATINSIPKQIVQAITRCAHDRGAERVGVLGDAVDKMWCRDINDHEDTYDSMRTTPFVERLPTIRRRATDAVAATTASITSEYANINTLTVPCNDDNVKSLESPSGPVTLIEFVDQPSLLGWLHRFNILDLVVVYAVKVGALINRATLESILPPGSRSQYELAQQLMSMHDFMGHYRASLLSELPQHDRLVSLVPYNLSSPHHHQKLNVASHIFQPLYSSSVRLSCKYHGSGGGYGDSSANAGLISVYNEHGVRMVNLKRLSPILDCALNIYAVFCKTLKDRLGLRRHHRRHDDDNNRCGENGACSGQERRRAIIVNMFKFGFTVELLVLNGQVNNDTTTTLPLYTIAPDFKCPQLILLDIVHRQRRRHHHHHINVDSVDDTGSSCGDATDDDDDNNYLLRYTILMEMLHLVYDVHDKSGGVGDYIRVPPLSCNFPMTQYIEQKLKRTSAWSGAVMRSIACRTDIRKIQLDYRVVDVYSVANQTMMRFVVDERGRYVAAIDDTAQTHIYVGADAVRKHQQHLSGGGGGGGGCIDADTPRRQIVVYDHLNAKRSCNLLLLTSSTSTITVADVKTSTPSAIYQLATFDQYCRLRLLNRLPERPCFGVPSSLCQKMTVGRTTYDWCVVRVYFDDVCSSGTTLSRIYLIEPLYSKQHLQYVTPWSSLG